MGASCRPRLALCLHPLHGETSPHSFGQLGGQTDPRWWPSQQLAWGGGASGQGRVGDRTAAACPTPKLGAQAGQQGLGDWAALHPRVSRLTFWKVHLRC